MLGFPPASRSPSARHLQPLRRLRRRGWLFLFCKRGLMGYHKLTRVMWPANGQIRFLTPVWLTPEPISFWKATIYSPWRIQIFSPENRERKGKSKKEIIDSVRKEQESSS